MLICLYKTFFL